MASGLPNGVPKLAYTVPELAEALGISTTFIYRLVRAGQIPYKRVGAKLLFPVALLKEWLASAEAAQVLG